MKVNQFFPVPADVDGATMNRRQLENPYGERLYLESGLAADAIKHIAAGMGVCPFDLVRAIVGNWVNAAKRADAVIKSGAALAAELKLERGEPQDAGPGFALGVGETVERLQQTGDRAMDWVAVSRVSVEAGDTVRFRGPKGELIADPNGETSFRVIRADVDFGTEESGQSVLVVVADRTIAIDPGKPVPAAVVSGPAIRALADAVHRAAVTPPEEDIDTEAKVPTPTAP